MLVARTDLVRVRCRLVWTYSCGVSSSELLSKAVAGVLVKVLLSVTVLGVTVGGGGGGATYVTPGGVGGPGVVIVAYANY